MLLSDKTEKDDQSTRHRNCPACGVLIEYRSPSGFYHARKDNRACFECAIKARAKRDMAGPNNPNYRHGAYLNGTEKNKHRAPEYESWAGMIARCHTTTHKRYKDYGARGIQVVEEWRSDFSAFLTHVGPKPSAHHSIDRIDNNKDYMPGNVRWATVKEQNDNRRDVTLVTINGLTMSVPDWAKRNNISRSTVYHRIYDGWPVEEAITAKSDRNQPKRKKKERVNERS